jgi:hypothetical protein
MGAGDTFHFADIVADNLVEIQRDFKRNLKCKGFEYNEDAFQDTFISCNNTLINKKLTKVEGIKYFWTAYLNKLKSSTSQNSNTVYIAELSRHDEDSWGPYNEYEDIDEVDEQYNYDIDNLYNYIIDSVKNKYGERETKIFELHVCQGVHTKDLINMGYNDVNFEYLTKKIKRYINTHVIKNNKIVDELRNNIRA